MRPSSTQKPEVKELASHGLKILQIDTEEDIEPDLLRPFDTVLSCISPQSQLSQLNLATAAKAAGVKRFVPCGYITICPPSGVMTNRTQKQEVYNHIFKLHLPYTMVDTGFWHQLSYPKLTSGKVDHVHIYGPNQVFGDGNDLNLVTDLRDVGRFVARIIKDPRTLNKKVFTWSDELSQNQIYDLMEKLSGEKIDKKVFSEKELGNLVSAARKAYEANPTDSSAQRDLWSTDYWNSKYIRGDNTRENALYLGYLDAKELYPDFKPVTFEAFIQELLRGDIERPYKGRYP